MTGIPIRRDIAMTGEITLRGRVLPIGGLKEKMLAALRSGITTVFIPKDNEKDLADIPDNVKKGLKIIPVAHVDDVIARALSRKPEPIEWEEPAEPIAPAVDVHSSASLAALARTSRPGATGGMKPMAPEYGRGPQAQSRLIGALNEPGLPCRSAGAWFVPPGTSGLARLPPLSDAAAAWPAGGAELSRRIRLNPLHRHCRCDGLHGRGLQPRSRRFRRGQRPVS